MTEDRVTQAHEPLLEAIAWLRVNYPEQYAELLALVRSKP